LPPGEQTPLTAALAAAPGVQIRHALRAILDIGQPSR
jgi:hypothetical protein